MKNHDLHTNSLNHSENCAQDINPAFIHLINMLRLLRDECAGFPMTHVETAKLDLRPIFNALSRVEEINGPKQASPLVYRRDQVLEMTGWSRTTLWRRCKLVGISLGRDVFTLEEIVLLVKRRRNSARINV